MAYREPAVRVTQEFTNALPALAAFALPHVNVGPTFQVVTNKLAGDYEGLQTDYLYPEQILGTFVDTRPEDTEDLISYPVKAVLNQAVVEYYSTVGAGMSNPYDLNQFVDATTNVFQNVLPGDVIVVTGSSFGNDGAYTVREKINNNTLKTNETFAAAESGLTYSLRRNVQSTLGNIPVSVSAEADKFTVPSGISVNLVPFGACSVVSAKVLVSYRALRVEKSADVWEYKRVAELQADFGLDQIVPENPAVFAAFISLSTASVATNLLAMNPTFLSDELLSYANAFDVLRLTEMYAINVLSHSTSVHTALKAHCETLSQPNNALERVGIVNRKLVTKAVVLDERVTGEMEGTVGDAGNTILTDSAAQFITDGVVPGQFVNVTANAPIGRYKIVAVVSQTSLIFEGNINGFTQVQYFIDKNLQKQEQANVLAAYASSLASRRLVMVWPDEVKMPVGPNIRSVPGYFLGATVGALTTGLPTQQGLTNLSVSLYTGVVHSTKYFDRDQLNTIAGGGVMIFVQDVLNQTPLFVRHQLTTDTSAIKFQEYSITKNVDFIAKFIRNNHRQFIGQYNIVDTTFDDLKANAQGIITFLKDSTRLPKIGGVIRSGKLTTIMQDPANIDTIIEKYSLSIPVPLNNLDITIIV